MFSLFAMGPNRAQSQPCDPSITLSQRGYRLFAPVYDLIFGLSLQHGRRLAIAALDARPGDRVLEVGVGSGLSLSMYAPEVSVMGIDISSEMLNKARRRVARKKASRAAHPAANGRRATGL